MDTLLTPFDEKDAEDTQEQTEECDDEDEAEEVEEEKEENVEDCIKDNNQDERDQGEKKEVKQADILNLNNEVVKMRKEIKRVRALIIRKLTRQIGSLKKKKGKEADVEKNQRRAARLLEEIHAMKVLSPDLVTKTALQKTLKFEEVCKNPKSTISDRAIARIATYPQFNKKIENIKAAIKAFKEERMKGGKQGGKAKVQNNSEKTGKRLEKHETDVTVQQKDIIKEKDDILIGFKDSVVSETKKNTEILVKSADTADVQQIKTETKNAKQPSTNRKNVEQTITSGARVSESQIQIKCEKQHIAVPTKVDEEKKEEEGELESSDEEDKEYYDDSTEERFCKQSSQSEESDDDFFFGKVNKFKIKKKKDTETTDNQETGVKVEKDKLELETKPRSKSTSLQSVFCSSLSGPKQSAGGGAGRGSGGDKFRGQRKPNDRGGVNRDFNKHSKFQKQVSGEERSSGSKCSPEIRLQDSEGKNFGRGRGRGQGRGRGTRPSAFSQPAPKQALHPSWEASKRRKEQQGQLLAFQGKKIKFDDDDY